MSEPLLMPFQDLPFNGDNFVCQEFLAIKEKHAINVAIETGSCLYSTTKWLGENFTNVYTVEISEEYSKHGIHKVAGMLNVHTNIGDSVSFLNKMRDVLTPADRCLFFLDAHWGENCPLIEELAAISLLKTTPPVIAIHDFYTGDLTLGWDEYNGQRFDYQWIDLSIKNLESAFGCDYECYYNTEAEGAKRGLIYIVPKKQL